MTMLPQFGSRFLVMAEHRKPSDLHPTMAKVPGFEEHSVASGFVGPLPNHPLAFSVPDAQDGLVKSLLKKAGYEFDGKDSFLEGHGCVGKGVLEALAYRPAEERRLDKQA